MDSKQPSNKTWEELQRIMLGAMPFAFGNTDCAP